MRHAILGAGGVGGLIGAGLARIGETVTLIVRRETLDAHPPKLRLESTFGNWSVEVQWASAVPPADVLWVTVKATQLEGGLRSIADAGTVGAIVPLLNGIDHVELLRAKYGRDRVIPATIAGETERVSMGHIIHRSPFERLNVWSGGGADCSRRQSISSRVSASPAALSTTKRRSCGASWCSWPRWR